jgi:hypothetical protein
MSYTNLIQKDNPSVIWFLDDQVVTNGSVVKSNAIIDPAGKNGFYINGGSDVESVKFPIVFGGKSCISLKKTTNSGQIKIPSLDKMSRKDVGNESSLEFWVKVSNTSSAENVIVSKTNSETKIYIKNDYVVFRIGSSTNYRETSVQIDSINKPLHIVATYSSNKIGLIVNGVRDTTEILYASEYDSGGLTRIESLFPAYLNTDEYFYFSKPNDINVINFDSIALYSYVLPREKAVRHFVYGCGYNIPDEFVNKNAGVIYNFSMDNDSSIKKYFMGNGESWNISGYSNLYIDNGSVSIKDMQEPFIGISSSLKKSYELSLYKNGYFDLSSSNSYLQISNSENIISYGDGGWLLKFNGNTPTITTKQTLFYIGSDLSPNYIECYLIDDSGVKIKVDINGTVETLSSLPSINGLFYIGYYVDSADTSKSNIVFYPATGSPEVLNKPLLNSLSLPNQYLRIGSSNTWTNGYNELSGPVPNQNQTSLRLVSIKAAKKEYFSSLSWSYSNIGSALDFYTATPSYHQKRFLIASNGYGNFSIPQQSLSNGDYITPESSINLNQTYFDGGDSSTITPTLSVSGGDSITVPTQYIDANAGGFNLSKTGACRIDVGHPLGSTSATISISGKKYVDGLYDSEFLPSTSLPVGTSITSGSWLNARPLDQPSDTSNVLDLLSFTLNLYTDDLKKKPTKFNYLNISSFDINSSDQVMSNCSSGGNPLKIWKTLGSTFAIPDLKETPVLYNGFYSGFKIQNTYATINNSFVSLEESGLGLVSFMLNVPYKSSGESVKIMSFENGATVKSISVNTNTGVLSSLDSNIKVYINGVIYNSSTNKINTDQWQNISVYLVTPYDTDTIPIISIGESSSTVKTYHEIYIDQLMLFYRPFSSQSDAEKTITNIYNLLSGNVPYSATDTNIFKLNDTSSVLNNIDYVGSVSLQEIDYQTTIGKFLPQGPNITGQDTYTYTTGYVADARDRKVSWGLAVVGNTNNTDRIKFNDNTGIFIGSSFNVNGREHTITAAQNAQGWQMSAPKENLVANTSVFMRNYAVTNNLKESNKLKLGKSGLASGDLILFGDTFLYQVESISAVSGTNPVQYRLVLTKQPLSTSTIYFIGSKKYSYNGSFFIEDYLTREKTKNKVAPSQVEVVDQEQ